MPDKSTFFHCKLTVKRKTLFHAQFMLIILLWLVAIFFSTPPMCEWQNNQLLLSLLLLTKYSFWKSVNGWRVQRNRGCYFTFMPMSKCGFSALRKRRVVFLCIRSVEKWMDYQTCLHNVDHINKSKTEPIQPCFSHQCSHSEKSIPSPVLWYKTSPCPYRTERYR